MRWALDIKQHKVALPNINGMYPSWEADLLAVTAADLVHEFEIKITRSDFLADAKKERKHWCLSCPEMCKVPNYFWYAIHGFSLDENDVPPYAGLIVVEKTGFTFPYAVNVIKVAPRIHGEKIHNRDKRSMVTWLSYKLKKAYLQQYVQD